jgi:YbbR domain-containing protein
MINILRNLIFRDFWLKLFSLILALGVWKVVSKAVDDNLSPRSVTTAMKQEKVFAGVKVLVVSSAADVRNFKVHPEVVEVTVRAESQFLEGLKATDIRAIVDLTDIEAARGLTKRIEVSTPPGVTYTKISPEEVSVVVPPK